MYNINIGPQVLCHFCGLELETADHILWNCNRLQFCWMNILIALGLPPHSISKLSYGDWLISSFKAWTGDTFGKAVIATVAWHIWKARCCLIFQNKSPDFNHIMGKS